MYRAIFFDADGVLIDSLRPHALYLNDINESGNFGLKLPSAEEIGAWKAIAKTPMDEFFRSAGFPRDKIEELMKEYSKNFSLNTRYAVKPFEGIDKMAAHLGERGKFLGILTSNYSANVASALGIDNMNKFHRVIDYSYMSELAKRNDGFQGSLKGRAFKHYLDHEISRPTPFNEIVLVGDTNKDFDAAQVAGVNFIGVSYGWEIGQSDGRFPVVGSVRELEERLLSGH